MAASSSPDIKNVKIRDIKIINITHKTKYIAILMNGKNIFLYIFAATSIQLRSEGFPDGIVS